jgi:hypothetical protein
MTHRKLRLSLAGIHAFVGIGGIVGGIVLTVAPIATPHILRLAVPRAITLSGLSLLLIGASALLVAWTTLRADRSAAASVAAAVGLLTWVVAPGILLGLRTPLQVLIVLVAVAAILLTAALNSAERRRAPLHATFGRLATGS